MLNWFGFNQAQFNQAVAVASSIDSGSTRSPFGHIIVAIPGGDLVLIYQQGTNGLCYRVSTNGGTVWGIENVIDTKTTVYASAVVNPTTKDIHVIYSKHGDPTTSDEAIYYRPLIWDSGASDWNVGGEQTLAGGGGLYDAATAGRRNASISVGDDGFPVVTYLRNENGVITWAMLISQEAWAFTDFDVDLDIGVVADEDSRGAAIQTDSRSIYFISRTGSWYSLASVTSLTNPIASIGIDMTVLFSWLGAESEHVAVARNDDGDRLGIVYKAGDGSPHFRLYNLTTSALVSDTEMDTATADSVTVTWDGALFWMAWVANDIIEISNSGAPATVVQTFANPGPDEDWSWLNSPVSCVDSATIVFCWCATASSIYTGAFLYPRAVAVDEIGSGSDSATIAIAVDETGAGADAGPVYEAISPAADTGTGVDTISAGPSVTDTGTGVDAVGKTVTVEETGAGTDSVQIAMSVAETGAGADGVSFYAGLALADTGAGTGTQAVRLVTSDTGEGVTTDSVGLPNAEAGVGVDAAIIGLTGAAESGVGTDAVAIGISLDDIGVGVDAIGSVNKDVNEAGMGVDSVVVTVAVAETGAGVDIVGTGNQIFINVTDSGTGVDTPAITWIPTAVVVRLLQHKGEVRLKIES